jgi:hypothetical protein
MAPLPPTEEKENVEYVVELLWRIGWPLVYDRD